MEFIIDKPKTWKGYAYVFGSSILKNEMITNGIDCYTHLVYWTPQGDNKTNSFLIEAEYWSPNENVPYYRFYIRSGVVPSNIRKEVESIFIAEVLPKLIEWMQKKINEPVNSRIKLRMFCAYYRNGQLILNQ